MKKILLLSLGISLILISSGCEIQFWPDDKAPAGRDEANEVSGVTPSDKKKSDNLEYPGASDTKPPELDPSETTRNTDFAPIPLGAETERTSGKIYAESSEGIRPSDAVNQRERSPIFIPESSSKTTFRQGRPQIKLANKTNLSTKEYWYECNYYGDCWDSENYIWYDCFYDAYGISCEKGNYWLEENINLDCDKNGLCKDSNGFEWYDPEKDQRVESVKEPACCDSWGNCYDAEDNWMADPKYMAIQFCDECGNCYDYYGNFVYYEDNYYDSYLCDNFYYYYDSVAEWDVCGNAYDKAGKFLFYDNYYYDYQSCNLDYSACDGAAANAIDCDGQGTCYDNGEAYKDSFYLVTDYCDECGNCYDFYGNETEFDNSYLDDYWCSQYYQYDQVESFDACGNAYDKKDEFLFYDNEHYDYKTCFGIK